MLTARLCSGHIGSVLFVLIQQAHSRQDAKQIRKSVQMALESNPDLLSDASLSHSCVYSDLHDTKHAISKATVQHVALLKKCTALQQRLDAQLQHQSALSNDIQSHRTRKRLLEMQRHQLQEQSALLATYKSVLMSPAPGVVAPEQFDEAMELTVNALHQLLKGDSSADNEDLKHAINALEDIPLTMRITAHKAKNAALALQQVKIQTDSETLGLTDALNTARRKHVNLLKDIKEKQDNVEQLAKLVDTTLGKMDSASRPSIMARAEKRAYTAALHHLRSRMEQLRKECNSKEISSTGTRHTGPELERLRSDSQALLRLRTNLLRCLVQDQQLISDYVNQHISPLRKKLETIPVQYHKVKNEEKTFTYDHYLPALTTSITEQQPFHYTTQEWWKNLLDVLSLPIRASPASVCEAIINTQRSDYEVENAIKHLCDQMSHLNDAESSSLPDLLQDPLFSKCSPSLAGLHTAADIIATKQRQHTERAVSEVQERQLQLSRIKQTLDEIRHHTSEQRPKLFSSIGGDIRIGQQTYHDAYKQALQ